ncbi:FAD-dependent oxidoreductase [Nocardia seriolae]|uniref:Oxidoreductase n=1 Tax=Nocardia seriolae TaxID=37332 RepID=A0ABC9Z1Q1_9NOCA|nr:FAD-dependent oxidoreductase [Nocardia seriolae]BEK96575.1 GMC family oxidoreductase [Nocardia seriolae]GAM49565.1 oxidoreductase [Nocardia seriolae]GAP31552.1 oxidoreductase [Nocardia seriolae]
MASDVVRRDVLGMICDAFAPGDGGELLAASELGVVDTVMELLGRNPREAERKQFEMLMQVWDSRLFGLINGAGWKKFSRLSGAERERWLLGMAGSRIEKKRALFQALKGAAVTSYYLTPGPTGTNPVWDRIGFPAAFGPLAGAERGLSPERPERDSTVVCDVVVIGSGAGGGTAAAVLARAGLDVVVLERGEYLDDPDFGIGEKEGFLKLYAPGPAATAEGQLGLVAGTALGGGTVVNWTTSFRTPEDVREEWAGVGARQFAEQEYTDALDAVVARLGVNLDHSPASRRDEILERGLRKLDWHVEPLPRNVGDACDAGIECGRCGFGCRVGAKRSVVKTWLADAAEAGARLYVGTDVRRIVVSNGSATGVEAVTADGGSVWVRARAVVVAAGAVQTPALLRRSGRGSRNIGAFLRLHPATAVFGVFDEEIRPWEGGMQTRYSKQDRDLDGNGYGVIYETGPLTPGMSVGFQGWTGGAAHRDRMLKLADTVAVGIITRDRDHGRVETDRKGEAVVRYRLSARDAAHMHTGIVNAASILEAAGAERIFSGHQAGVGYEPGVSGSHEQFARRAAAAGYAPGQCSMGALHIMGSARMGGSPADSATNPDGVTWDVPNIVVADGSCFPTASGVNPMVSIEAIAHMNATRLAARLKEPGVSTNRTVPQRLSISLRRCSLSPA